MFGGKMGKPHGGIGLVDMLPAGAAGAVGIDAQIGFVDFDFDIVVHFRIDENRGERSMAPRIGVEGRYAHEPVNTRLGFQIAIGVVAFHQEGHAFNARLFAGLIFENLFPITAPITPAQIHAQEYFGPILCLRATRAGMKVDDRIAPVVRAAEQLGEFRLRQLFADRSDFRRSLVERFLTFLLLGYVEEKTRLLEIRVVLFPNTDERLESGLFLENDLGFFAVVPKIGLCRELV